jgi:hypothetical protein
MGRIIETYRRVPEGWAFALAAIVSWGLAAIAGIAGGVAGMYLYDRGMSKGDDLAVLTSGLLAVGTLAFVVLFTWLRKLHHAISSRTPLFAWLFCLAGTVVTTSSVVARPLPGRFGPLHRLYTRGLDRDCAFWAGGAGPLPALVRSRTRLSHGFCN